MDAAQAAEQQRQAMGEHSAYLARYSAASVNKILAQLRRSEIRIASELAILLAELTPAQRTLLNQGSFTGPGGSRIVRLERIKEQIQALAAEYRSIANSVIREDGKALVASEVAFAQNFASAFSVTGELAAISANQVYIAAVKNPFEGRVLRDYTRSLEQNTRNEILKTIRDGFATGESTPDTIKRILGNRVIYRDGSVVPQSNPVRPANRGNGGLIPSKNAISRLVRTSYTHFSAQAYLQTYAELGVEEVIYTATIDGRTSLYCSSRDRNVYRVDDPKRPFIPAHPNCRSVWTPKLEEEPTGVRPFVKSDKSVSQLGRDVRAGRITKAERDRLIGQVSATDSFEDVLRNDKAFARQYLGDTRYKLWNSGRFDFEKFSDPRGRNYSISELEASNRALFRRLGLNTDRNVARAA